MQTIKVYELKEQDGYYYIVEKTATIATEQSLLSKAWSTLKSLIWQN